MEKVNQKAFRVQKIIKWKDDKLYVIWKGDDNLFKSWIDTKDIVWMSEYFPEPIPSGGRVKVELDLYNYATKAGLVNGISLLHQNLQKCTN